MSTPPPAVPPVVPSRSSSGHIKHGHTFLEMYTDDCGYMRVEPSTVPISPTKSVSQSVTSNPTPPATPTSTKDPVAPVDAVVGIMKNMSTDQMQMLSKLNPGAKAENSPMQPLQLCKTESYYHVVAV